MNRPVRILQLLQGLAIGGIERMVLDLVFALDRSEFETSFCTFDRQGQLASEVRERNMPLWFRLRDTGIDVRWVLWLAGILRRERIGILHAHNATAFFYGAAATTLVPGTRFLYTEHDRAFPTPFRERRLHALLARRAHAVVTVSDKLKHDLERWEAFPAARVHVVKNGVALRAPSMTRAAMRAELGLGDRPTAGIVARMAPVKNHALLIRAWKQVVDVVPNAVLLIVGDGTQEPAARALVGELGLEQSVRFLGFRLDIPELLAALDVFVLSSRSEGLSLTLLEAMAAGLPIVATEVGGNPEVVQDGKTGFLVPSGEPAPMAQALARLLQDPGLRTVLGEQGRTVYHGTFTHAAMVQGYEHLYRQLAGLPEPGARPHPAAPAPLEAEGAIA